MRVLIADDDRVSRRLLRAILEKNHCEVVEAEDGSGAWAALQKPDSPRLAILDWMMPGMDGTQICNGLRKRTSELYVYVLLLTTKNLKADVISGLEAGADDYLTKPFDVEELLARLRIGKRIIDLQGKLIAAREALRNSATHDFLTDLWNRRAVVDLLKSELNRTQRQHESLSIIILDIDHFKAINDTYGHQVGDTVLREVANKLSSIVRPYDAAGRYGGEEFLIVLPRCDEHDSVEIAERIRARIGDYPVDTYAGRISVTASLGVSTAGGGNSVEFEAFLRSADDALYRAKRAGRNRVEVAALTSIPGNGASVIESLPVAGGHKTGALV
jgi:diguanylate cyclase (GGDEF)-like protein